MTCPLILGGKRRRKKFLFFSKDLFTVARFGWASHKRPILLCEYNQCGEKQRKGRKEGSTSKEKK